MGIVVLKFGGTSLRNINKESHVFYHVKNYIEKGYTPVVVVSAIGRKGEAYATDTLIKQLESINFKIDPKKKDLIMSSGETISAAIVSHYLDTKGIPAEALTGIEAGIFTDKKFNSSNIININTDRILEYIGKNKVPVIAGFQGVTKDMEITTLGRGGSDITAVSLGGYLAADKVIIFTDVPGLATIDPGIIPSANFLELISYDDMYTLSSNGVNVLHPKAVKLGKKFNVPIEIRSSFRNTKGTTIMDTKDGTLNDIIGIAINKSDKYSIITLLFSKNFDADKKSSFEKFILTSNFTLETNWDNNKLSIILDNDKAIEYSKIIHNYFFP